MFAIAYRMLGAAAEAEDVVQEALLRMHASTEPIRSPDAFATTITTRLAIDTLRSARVRRERYVGPWLPEPLLVSADDPALRVEQDETISTAFLILMERLTPIERAVFLLREVFDLDYAEIAEVVQKSEVNCRRILSRAKGAIDSGRPRFEADRQAQERLARRFLDTANEGDLDALKELLSEDVVFIADGGGKAPAVREPILGAERVARFIASLVGLAGRTGMRVEIVAANGLPAWQVWNSAGEVLAVMTIQVERERVSGLYNTMNPDKLAHLGPVGDINVLIGGAR